MSQRVKPFGHALREKRLEKGHSLRKFAELVGVSPTYLSQVEQGNVDPPTAERVKRMAELLDENPDEWTALAGRVPEDLPEIIQKQPTEMPELLREASGLTAQQLRKLTEQAKKTKGTKKLISCTVKNQEDAARFSSLIVILTRKNELRPPCFFPTKKTCQPLTSSTGKKKAAAYTVTAQARASRADVV
jgi:transcriptional regulator with XRE-family HTH domain